MSEYLELTFDVFDETGQRASVLRSLTVRELLDEISIEFDVSTTAAPQAYGLSLEGKNRQLEPGLTLIEQGVQSGDRLVLGWARDPYGMNRQPVTDPALASLRETNTRTVFPIRWQPAIIGRPDSNHVHNAMLVANLDWLPKSNRVSRYHAQITEKKGAYYLESIAANNPTYLNGEALEAGRQYKLAGGDAILLGLSDILLDFVLRPRETI